MDAAAQIIRIEKKAEHAHPPREFEIARREEDVW